MSSPRYRVVQWATGNTGQRALREVIRHPNLDLVGVLVYDDAKDGVDAGSSAARRRPASPPPAIATRSSRSTPTA